MNDIADKLHFFASFANIYCKRFMNPLWNRYSEKETNPWDSLGLFLEGYAFERQGRRPDYAHVAKDVIMNFEGDKLSVGRIAETVWERFGKALNNTGLNEVNNPLCPRRTNYKRKTGLATTNKQSIIEFISELQTWADQTSLRLPKMNYILIVSRLSIIKFKRSTVLVQR